MKVLKQTCIAGEIKVYETHKVWLEVKDGKKLCMISKCAGDKIETCSPYKQKDEIIFWTDLTSYERSKVFSTIEKALGKTL